jgi:hypothetical protein
VLLDWRLLSGRLTAGKTMVRARTQTWIGCGPGYKALTAQGGDPVVSKKRPDRTEFKLQPCDAGEGGVGVALVRGCHQSLIKPSQSQRARAVSP